MTTKPRPMVERSPRHTLKHPEKLVVLVGNHVVALEPRTGDELWRSRLPGVFGQGIGTLLVQGDVVYAGLYGRLHCLSLEDGRILWSAELKGLGLGLVVIGTEDGPSSAPMALQSVVAQAELLD
ncbi:MAG: hypothetical protein HPKKFMNG_01782 [Planctomycetes bacterium]|nr:hypothetical protein [Planctomycetota bacterium]HRJ80038.1 PQQ-binding-like beta-propeller repeat protein [Planctomycetota bacterium]